MLRLSMPVFLLLATLALVSRAPAADPPAPKTTSDPALAASDLDLLAKPLTREELVIESNAWMKLLQEKVSQISQAEIAAGKAEKAEDKTKLLDEAAKFREQRTQLIDRLNVILAALRQKGGKSDDYDQYVAAVSGLTVKMTDVSATYTTIINWLKSGEGGIRYGKNIALFLATLLVFRVLAGIAAGITRRTMSAFRGVSNLLRDFVVNVVSKVVFFVGFVVALSMLEVNIGPFLAAMGAAGFVIGFALQGTLGNFAAGVMILLYRPYDIGDTVTVAGVTGKVTSMTLVSTMLRNNEGHSVTIPNSSIWGGTITNFTDGKDDATAAPAK